MRADLIRALAAKGFTADQIADIAEALRTDVHREKDRLRKRTQRAKLASAAMSADMCTASENIEQNQQMSRDVTRDMRDTPSPSPSPSSSPLPLPLRTTPPSPPTPPRSLRSLAHRPARDDVFERFWSVYPRRVGKGAARKSFDRAASKADPEAIILAAGKIQTDGDLQFVPHPSTWLNQERWNDEHPSGPTGETHAKSASAGAERLIEAAKRGEFTFGPKPTLGPKPVTDGRKDDHRLLPDRSGGEPGNLFGGAGGDAG